MNAGRSKKSQPRFVRHPGIDYSFRPEGLNPQSAPEEGLDGLDDEDADEDEDVDQEEGIPLFEVYFHGVHDECYGIYAFHRKNGMYHIWYMNNADGNEEKISEQELLPTVGEIIEMADSHFLSPIAMLENNWEGEHSLENLESLKEMTVGEPPDINPWSAMYGGVLEHYAREMKRWFKEKRKELT